MFNMACVRMNDMLQRVIILNLCTIKHNYEKHRIMLNKRSHTC